MAHDLIGSSPLRKEDRRLLVGAGRYLDDLRREGTAHLGIVRSPQPHEKIRHARLAAAPIEPRGVLAYRDPESGGLVVSSSTQNPYRVREVIAAILGWPVEQVRIVVPDVGGGFGPKGGVYPEDVLVPA